MSSLSSSPPPTGAGRGGTVGLRERPLLQLLSQILGFLGRMRRGVSLTDLCVGSAPCVPGSLKVGLPQRHLSLPAAAHLRGGLPRSCWHLRLPGEAVPAAPAHLHLLRASWCLPW